jgi:hypothetical protein
MHFHLTKQWFKNAAVDQLYQHSIAKHDPVSVKSSALSKNAESPSKMFSDMEKVQPFL